MASEMSPRSTKGASKQRRENINSEISLIRDLLPIQEQVRNRLSQLQIMSLCKAYIGKSNMLSTLQSPKFEETHPFDFTQALSGFMLITDLNGRILYVSDNVTDYLAHSMVDVITQAETIYELVHTSDRQIFGSFLTFGDQSSLVGDSTFTFTCRMGMLKHPRRNPTFDRYKKMRIFGRKIAVNDGKKGAYFVALCTPRLNPVMASDPSFVFDTMVFKSVHRMDMKFISIDHNGQHHFGYSNHEINMKSWYEMIHPDDIELAVRKHNELMQQSTSEASCSLSLRLQTKSGQMLCVQMILRKESSDVNGSNACIVCWNQVVCPNEMSIDDKEDLLYQMNTINYLDHYVSTQNSEKKVSFNGQNGNGSMKDKKCDRSELMEKLKRKMQKPELEKVKISRMENGLEDRVLKEIIPGNIRNFVEAASNRIDLFDFLPGNSSVTNFDQNANFLLASSFNASNFGLITAPSFVPDRSLVEPNGLNLTGSSLNNDKFTMSSQAILDEPQFYNFDSAVVTMPTPERKQTWSPCHTTNYLAGSPTCDDLNNQSFFSIPLDKFRQPMKQEINFQTAGEKRSTFPELKPQEVDDYFEKEASANFLEIIKNEESDQFARLLDSVESNAVFSDQFTQNFLQQLSTLAY